MLERVEIERIRLYCRVYVVAYIEHIVVVEYKHYTE